MGTDIEITASDGHTFAAYRADPEGAPKGGILVVQEAFGVNPHIRHMADTYAAAGYLAIAPALYDRVERGIEVGYTGDDRDKGIGAMQASNFDDVMKDIDATRALLAEAGKVGITGWCCGGSVTFLSACRVDGLACASIELHLKFVPLVAPIAINERLEDDALRVVSHPPRGPRCTDGLNRIVAVNANRTVELVDDQDHARHAAALPQETDDRDIVAFFTGCRRSAVKEVMDLRKRMRSIELQAAEETDLKTFLDRINTRD